MIEFIEIENFRGIAKGRIDGFTQLNVFIGKNNSGKSTILEALAIVLNYDLLSHIIKRRGWYGLDTVLSIFRFRNPNKNINISINNLKISIKKEIGYAEEVEFLIKTQEFNKDCLALNITNHI